MFFILALIACVILAIYAFIDVQLYLVDPDLKEKRAEWFEKFLEHNKETYSDPQLAWRYNVIENLFDGIHT